MKEINTTLKIYCDLDGVLCNFQGYVEQLFGCPIADISGNKLWRKVSPLIRDREFFSNLQLMPGALRLFEYITRTPGTEILTATGTNFPEHACAEKTAWVRKHLSKDIPVNCQSLSTDKAAFAAPGHILIDDRAKSIFPWVQKSGIGILYKNADQTIKELKALGL